MRTAKAIGISQGLVSKHVAAKPLAAEPLITRLTAELLLDLEAGTPTSASAWCTTLTITDATPGGDQAVADVLAAEAMLSSAMPLRLMPQIGLNIARALPDSQTPQDVLSYPGRLVDAGGNLVAPAPPAFGASGHLARCLLHLRGRDPSLMALANVRGGSEAMRAAKKLGWRVVEIAADRRGDAEAPFRRAVDGEAKPPTVLHDGKAIGIEPCLYVAAVDATALARLVVQLDGAAMTTAVKANAKGIGITR